jgi:hypothetical protein
MDKMLKDHTTKSVTINPSDNKVCQASDQYRSNFKVKDRVNWSVSKEE